MKSTSCCICICRLLLFSIAGLIQSTASKHLIDRVDQQQLMQNGAFTDGDFHAQNINENENNSNAVLASSQTRRRATPDAVVPFRLLAVTPIRKISSKPVANKPSAKPSLSKPVKQQPVKLPIKQPIKAPLKQPFKQPIKPVLKPVQKPSVPTGNKPTIGHVGSLNQFGKIASGERTGSTVFGVVIALNADGSIVAVSDFGFGSVKVFRFSANLGKWQPYGEPASLFAPDYNGNDLSIFFSGNGQLMAVGAFIFRFMTSNSSWTRIADFSNVSFTSSLSLDGNVVALPGNPITHVYKWNGKVWKLYGTPLNATSNTVSLSANGTIISLQTPNAVQVLHFAGNNKWVPLGNIINATDAGSILQAALLSANGQRVAILSNVFVRVYQYHPSRSKWLQVGSGVPSRRADSGDILCFSGDGTILAVGSNIAQVFQVPIGDAADGGAWKQIGTDFLNDFVLVTKPGVALSTNGKVYAETVIDPDGYIGLATLVRTYHVVIPS